MNIEAVILDIDPPTVCFSLGPSPTAIPSISNEMDVNFLGSVPEKPKFSEGQNNVNKFLKDLQRYTGLFFN